MKRWPLKAGGLCLKETVFSISQCSIETCPFFLYGCCSQVVCSSGMAVLMNILNASQLFSQPVLKIFDHPIFNEELIGFKFTDWITEEN